LTFIDLQHRSVTVNFLVQRWQHTIRIWSR